MCHYGNPWLPDAACTVRKNENVTADLSGLLEGKIVVDEFFREEKGYTDYLETWIKYMGDYSKLMYGTDWPLANLENYIQFTKRLIPEKHWEAVFAGNAARVYGLEDWIGV